MARRQWVLPAAVFALLAVAVPGVRPTSAQHGGQQHAPSTHPGRPAEDGHSHGKVAGVGGMGGHVHAEVPSEYTTAHLPASAWTSPRMLARGKTIYRDRCALCHGEIGDGQGPATAAVGVKPPDLRDRSMVGVMQGNYWFWRVSEGAAVEPFRSAGSIMPAWKDVLSIEDRWAVIAYQHRFSGHMGPHVTSEHPEMLSVGDRALPQTDANSLTSPTGGGAHRHSER